MFYVLPFGIEDADNYYICYCYIVLCCVL